ncbi:50S ribosomal protein L35 [Listeria monocytogenes]|nr:50S ribosomal protein L35 [Listeria monocytogenes]
MKPCLRFNFPDPVLLKRLAEPRWVFIFGMNFSSSKLYFS